MANSLLRKKSRVSVFMPNCCKVKTVDHLLKGIHTFIFSELCNFCGQRLEHFFAATYHNLVVKCFTVCAEIVFLSFECFIFFFYNSLVKKLLSCTKTNDAS